MEEITILTEIAEDTIKGLSSEPKYLLPKYFYDDSGSKIFQQIMHMDEYYLTDCEYEIFYEQKMDIAKDIRGDNSYFDLIELGSGDGLKTKVLLTHLVKTSASFTYVPIDISEHANNILVNSLKKEIPELRVHPETGDYFQVMKNLSSASKNRKVIFFLGANIGNFSDQETTLFFQQLHDLTNTGDLILIGFDLKKSPGVIRNAYADSHGYTKDFNLNHLLRLNKELGADFKTEKFEQHTVYDPVSGAVKSYLVSKENQTVNFKTIEHKVEFEKWEPVFMELSQKYSYNDIKRLAQETGFKVRKNYTDRKEYFVDSLWERT